MNDEAATQARHPDFESFHFAHDVSFLESQPKPHFDEREASEGKC
jgi:hypothetical protein